MTLTPHQSDALLRVKDFVKAADQQVFVLQGYAGTGKTTLVSHIVQWLKDTNLKPMLLATTGRAAKVLQNKTDHSTSTLHSCIYTFDSITGSDDEQEDAWASPTGQLILDFNVKVSLEDSDNVVYIVDEASMITHEMPGEISMAKFGSGSLLDDFIHFAGKNKIIFVGDPCQLPPIAENPFSSALDPHFMAQRYEISTASAELSQIMRQDDGSEILQVAGRFRDALIRNVFEKYPKIKLPQGNNVQLHPNEKAMVQAYIQHLKQFGLNDSIMICQANWLCTKLNTQIRAGLGHAPQLQVGDMLMVVQNSYHVNLANGDQVVVDAIENSEHRGGLNFLSVTVRTLHDNKQYQTKLITDLLYNDLANLTAVEMKPLYIDFDSRMRNRNIPRNSELYKQAMLGDPYLNGLRTKFGYAITCHKSQGGEWKNVFLFMYKSLYGMKSQALYRWFYTALTRAQQQLHVNDGFWIQGFDYRK